jgi:hypothetical protein
LFVCCNRQLHPNIPSSSVWNKRTGWRIYAGMRLQIVAVAWLVLLAASLQAREPLSMAVSPAQSFAPTNLTIRVRVEPADVNRVLEVVADSGAYYRSSQIPLDGSQAPRTISIEFRNVPGGDYDVRGTLIGSAGKPRAAVRQHVIVLDPGATGVTP